MDYKQFTNAILEGTRVGAPKSSVPELANSMTGSFRASALTRPGQAQNVAATAAAEEEERRRKEAEAARKQQIQDQLDPSKYQKVRKDDGGFAFFDPTGKEIDIDTYAKRTGMRRVEAIADSENPLDQQFIDDYKQMNDLNQAVWRNDPAAISEYKMMYPDLFGGDKPPTPEDINRKLLEKYPHIFGMGNYQRSLSNLGNPLFRSRSTGGSSQSSSGRRSGLSL